MQQRGREIAFAEISSNAARACAAMTRGSGSGGEVRVQLDSAIS